MNRWDRHSCLSGRLADRNVCPTGLAHRNVCPTGMVSREEQEVIRVTGAEVVVTDSLAAVPALAFAAAEITDLGEGEEQIGVRRLDGLGVQPGNDLLGVAFEIVFEVENAQGLPGARR
jgi:hypothetical protein